MTYIARKERILMYNVFNNVIINYKQKLNLGEAGKVDSTEISKKRMECLLDMVDTNNLYSFIYIHHNGNIESEINVKESKYDFHLEYND